MIMTEISIYCCSTVLLGLYENMSEGTPPNGQKFRQYTCLSIFYVNKNGIREIGTYAALYILNNRKWLG